jgi:hypothetical protein
VGRRRDKHSRVLGPAWVRGSSKRTARGATVWHAADGSKPDPSYLTPREAQAELRRLLEHDAARRPTPRTAAGTPVTFADAAEAWLTHGERKRNLKRSTVNDYRQALDTYLLPAADGTSTTPYGRAAFAAKPLRDLRAADVKRWHDGLPYGRTTEKLLMVVRAVCAHARPRVAQRRPDLDGRAPAGSLLRRLRLLLARGDRRPGARRGIAAGRRDLLDRSDDRTASRRAGRVALARRRLHRPGDPGQGELQLR